MIFYSVREYLASCTSLQTKIAAIDLVIDSLLLAMIDSANVANIEEYSLNDGQTQIRAKYKDTMAITAQIKALEDLKEYWEAQAVAKCFGRQVKLVDDKSIRRLW